MKRKKLRTWKQRNSGRSVLFSFNPNPVDYKCCWIRIERRKRGGRGRRGGGGREGGRGYLSVMFIQRVIESFCAGQLFRAGYISCIILKHGNFLLHGRKEISNSGRNSPVWRQRTYSLRLLAFSPPMELIAIHLIELKLIAIMVFIQLNLLSHVTII